MLWVPIYLRGFHKTRIKITTDKITVFRSIRFSLKYCAQLRAK